MRRGRSVGAFASLLSGLHCMLFSGVRNLSTGVHSFMADKIYIDTQTYMQLAARLNSLAAELGDCASMLTRVDTSREAGGELRISISGSLRTTKDAMPDGSISACVSGMRRVIRNLREHTSELADRVGRTTDLFETVEHELANQTYAAGGDAVYSQVGAQITGDGVWRAAMADDRMLSAVFGGLAAAVDSIEGIWDMWDDMSSRIQQSTSASGKIAGSKSIFSKKAVFQEAGSTISASFTHVDMEGEISGSAFIFDQDGSFRPGANARIGGSFTVLEANSGAAYEVIDNVSIHSDIGATVGEVGVDGKINIGFDEDGNVNLGASASAEAILAEVDAEIGVDVAGVDVSAKGSLNVGIGAHAHAGYSDGVLKLDAGVAFGVGGSISLEVDVGDFVDNVADHVSDTIDAVSGKAERIWDFVNQHVLS